MRTLRTVFCVAILATMAGCANPIVGTWTGAPGASPIARATFANDGTFTAEAEYGQGKSHAMSGHYMLEAGKLKLEMDGNKREYEAKVVGDKLEMNYKGKTETMDRMKPKCCCGKGGDCCKK
jgi:hypothetical protein